MAEDPRDKLTRKTPPEDVARAIASGGVPRDFATEREPITGVGLSSIEEVNARARRIQSTTDAAATTITGQLAEHGAEIKSLRSDVSEMKVTVAEVAVAMPLMTKAVQDLTSAAIQRETVTTTTQIEISGARQMAEIDVDKTAKKAKIERGTKLVAIVSTLLALGLAALEAFR